MFVFLQAQKIKCNVATRLPPAAPELRAGPGRLPPPGHLAPSAAARGTVRRGSAAASFGSRRRHRTPQHKPPGSCARPAASARPRAPGGHRALGCPGRRSPCLLLPSPSPRSPSPPNVPSSQVLENKNKPRPTPSLTGWSWRLEFSSQRKKEAQRRGSDIYRRAACGDGGGQRQHRHGGCGGMSGGVQASQHSSALARKRFPPPARSWRAASAPAPAPALLSAAPGACRGSERGWGGG